MALSFCPKCNNDNFEITRVKPDGSDWAYYFVQCTQCGYPVGITEAENLAIKLDLLEESFRERFAFIENQLKDIENRLDQALGEKNED